MLPHRERGLTRPEAFLGTPAVAFRPARSASRLFGDALHQPPVVSPIAPELEPLIDNIALF